MSFILVDDGEVSYLNPLGEEKMRELEALLRKSECFFPPFVNADPYSASSYINAYAINRTQTVFLLDRNIYSQVIALAKGASVNDKNRVAAAVMAFASCANVDMEPSLAMHEGSASGARGGWRRNLALFHAADDISPINWAALALGLAERFTRKIRQRQLAPDIARDFNPKMRLRAYGFVYPILMKMALIQRGGGERDLKMLRLISWIYDAWHFSAPALHLASLVFGEQPPKKVFKGIGGTDRRRALRGVKNAAWDLVYVTEWYKNIHTQADSNVVTVLCTRDVVLGKVASQLKRVSFGEDAPNFLAAAKFGSHVQDLYRQCSDNLSNPKRALVPLPNDFVEYRDELVAKLEKNFLSPDRRGS